MGNTASERVHGWGHGDRHRRDSPKAKEDNRSNILIDSSEDADLFHADDPKGPESQEFFAWQQDLESDIKSPSQNRPTMFRWTGGGKDVYLSGSFNNWATKIPLSRSQSNFVAVLDLPEGEHQYKYYVDGQWTLDHKEPMTVGKTGTINNVIRVKQTDFEVFDALKTDSEKTADVSAVFTLAELPVISAEISGSFVAFPLPTWGGVSKQHTNSTHLGPYTFLRHGASVNTSRGETGHRVWYGDVSQLPLPTVGTFKTAEQSYKNTNKKFRDLSSSPPGPYHQEAYSVRPDERLRSPPILPPHLLQVLLNKDIGVSCDPALLPEPNHVMLNHLYALSIKDGVMVLSATHRYKKKYVTTLLYKPI